MKTLAELYALHAICGPDAGHGDKGGTHSYIDEYETLLAPYRERCSFMEIGLAYGLSVAMWEDYFGSDCTLTGVDIDLVFDTAAFPRWDFIQADATTQDFVDSLGNQRFDVVIDDASHDPQAQIATLGLLRPRMNPGGLYIIEDILWLDDTRHLYASGEIRDLRSKKGRFDDVLVLYHF